MIVYTKFIHFFELSKSFDHIIFFLENRTVLKMKQAQG